MKGGSAEEIAGLAMAGAVDRVYQELAAEARLLRPSCRSRALLPPSDLIALLQRLSTCRPQDRAL